MVCAGGEQSDDGRLRLLCLGVKTPLLPVEEVKTCSRPYYPPRADGMFGTELVSLEAGAAEEAFRRVDAILVLLKYSHRTHINA
jgi:hypothetical protein